MDYFSIYVECLTHGKYDYSEGYKAISSIMSLPMTLMLRKNRDYLASNGYGYSLSYSFYMIERLCEVGIESRLLFTRFYDHSLNGYVMKAAVMFKDGENWFVSDYSSDVKSFTERNIDGKMRLSYISADGDMYLDDDSVVNNSKMSLEEYLNRCSLEENKKALLYNLESYEDNLIPLVFNLGDIRLSKITFMELLQDYPEFREDINCFKKIVLK